jgi:hypothetical protein
MSSCNAVPQMWAINPTRTSGCASKRSCNGAPGAGSDTLQEFCVEDAAGAVKALVGGNDAH